MQEAKSFIKRLSSVLGGVAAFVVHFWLYWTLTGFALEPWLSDFWFRVRGPLPPPSEVTIVSLDEETYKELGIAKDQIVPRSVMGQVLRTIARGEPKLVVVDYNFWGEVSDPRDTESLVEAMHLVPTIISTDPREKNLPPNKSIAGAAVSVASGVLAQDTGLLPGDDLKVRRFRLTPRQTIDMPTLAEASADYLTPRPHPLPFELINYFGPAGALSSVSAQRILKFTPEQLRNRFRGRVVFLGIMTPREIQGVPRDLFLTPYANRRTFGVEIHATAAANIMRADWLRRADFFDELVGLSLVAAAIVALVIIASPQVATLCVASYLALWAVISYAAFERCFFLPGLTAALLCFGTLIVKILSAAISYRREALLATAALELSTSPQVFSKIRGNALKISREAEERYIVALFADIEKFSAITQTLSRDRHQELVNDFCDAAERLILDHQGTLVTIYGDAFFAMWGAPVALPDSEQRALAVALALPSVVQKVTERHGVRVRARVGITAGTTMVGNFGSRRRLHYSAYGEIVNTSARLEGLNKEYGTEILATASVFERCDSTVHAISMGMASLDTEATPVSLVAFFSEPIDACVLKDWEAGLEAFGDRRWKDAEALLGSAADADSRLLKASKLLVKWAQNFEARGVPSGWAGQIYFQKRLSPPEIVDNR